MRSIWTTIILAALVASIARADTAKAPAQGRALAEQIAATVASTANDGNLAKLLATDAVIRRFGNAEPLNISQLRAQASGKSVVAMHTYTGTPATLATDLAADFQDASVPDSLKRIMTPPTPTQLQHANDVGGELIRTTLVPASTDVVGLIVLETAPGAAGSNAASAPMFILFKAQVAQDGRLVAKTIAFGDPRE